MLVNEKRTSLKNICALFVAVVSTLMAAAALLFFPHDIPAPSYLEGAQQLLASGKISVWHNVGYMLFISLGLKVGGMTALLGMQAALYVGIVTLLYWLLINVDVSPFVSGVGAVLIGCHPIVLINIPRISDISLSLFLIIPFLIVLIRIEKSRSVFFYLLMLYIILTLMVLTRSNYIFLIPIIFLSFNSKSRFGGLRIIIAKIIVIVAVIFSVCFVNKSIKGKFQLADSGYAAYTLHNGNNHRSAGHFLKYTTGEFSSGQALRERGIDAERKTKEEMTDIYRSEAITFIRKNPLEYIKLVFVRAATFFRPDYRRVDLSVIARRDSLIFMQTVLAAPIFIWIILRIVLRNRVKTFVGFQAPILLFLYITPFLLIYADPRYRWPLDCILLVDILAILFHASIFKKSTPLT